MVRTHTAALRRRMIALLVCLLGSVGFDSVALGSANGARIAGKLDRAGLIDNYFPEVAFEVGSALAQAAPGQWRGVQVKQAHRPGWLNVYMLDARRLPESGLLRTSAPSTCGSQRRDQSGRADTARPSV